MVYPEPRGWYPFRHHYCPPLLERSYLHRRYYMNNENCRSLFEGPFEMLWHGEEDVEESVEKKKMKRKKTATNMTTPLKKKRSLQEVVAEIEEAKERLPLFNFSVEDSDEEEIDLDVVEPKQSSERVGNLMGKGPLKLCTQLADQKNVAPSSKDV